MDSYRLQIIGPKMKELLEKSLGEYPRKQLEYSLDSLVLFMPKENNYSVFHFVPSSGPGRVKEFVPVVKKSSKSR